MQDSNKTHKGTSLNTESEFAIKKSLSRRKKLTKEAAEISELIAKAGTERGGSENVPKGALETNKTRVDGIKKEIAAIDKFLAENKNALHAGIDRNRKKMLCSKARIKDLAREIEAERKMLKLIGPEGAGPTRSAGAWRVVGTALLAASLSAGSYFGYEIAVREKKVAVAPREGTSHMPQVEEKRPKMGDYSPEEAIETIFELIREANMKKNLILYTSCFSESFPGFNERKNRILKNWEDYSFQDIKYRVRDLTISRDSADLKVDWLMDVEFLKSGKREFINASDRVKLRKERGSWKIFLLN